MKAHKNFGIAAAIFMAITVLTGFCKPMRKTHAVWGIITVICFIGATASGKKITAPRKVIDMTGGTEDDEEVKG